MEGKAIIKLDQEAIRSLLERSGIDFKALIEPYLERLISSIIKEKIEEYMNRWIKYNISDNCSKLFDQKIKFALADFVEEYEKDNKKLRDLVNEYWTKIEQSTEKQYKEHLARMNLIEENYLTKLIKKEVINYFNNK